MEEKQEDQEGRSDARTIMRRGAEREQIKT